MAYQKHNFETGDVLRAAQLNEIEDEIARQADALEEIETSGAAAGAVRYDADQTLTGTEKAKARQNIGAASAEELNALGTPITGVQETENGIQFTKSDNTTINIPIESQGGSDTAVVYDREQMLTDAQKGVARANIGAASAAYVAGLGTPITDVQTTEEGIQFTKSDQTTIDISMPDPSGTVRFDEDQSLTAPQMAKARDNIGAASASSVSALGTPIVGAQAVGSNIQFTKSDNTTISVAMPDSAGTVHYDQTQTLTEEQKAAARGNIGAVASGDLDKFVRHDQAQGLTDAQKSQVRRNISAASAADIQELTDALSQIENPVIGVTETQSGIQFTFADGTTTDVEISSGTEIASMEYDSNHYLHLYDANGQDVVPSVYIEGGESGTTGGSTLTFAPYTEPSFSVTENAESAIIEYKFTSTDKETGVTTGPGVLAVYVGSVSKALLNVAQGNRLSIDVMPYLSKGINKVRLLMTDSRGASAPLNFTITVETFQLDWSLDDVNLINENELSFYITPTGNGTKQIYTVLNGTAVGEPDEITTSGRRISKKLTGLNHGYYTLEVYGTVTLNGVEMTSNRLKAAIAVVLPDETDPVIAVNWPEGELHQFTGVTIPYMVIDPEHNPVDIQLMDGEEVIAEPSVDQSRQVWAYRPRYAGSRTVKIVCGNVSVQKTYTVSSIDIRAAEITTDLACKVDPSTISDLATWNYNGYNFTMSQNFDLVNGGVTVDSDGIPCIRVPAGDKLTLNYHPFASNAIDNGAEIKIIYKIVNSSDQDAVAIKCENNGAGFRCEANHIYLNGSLNSADMSVCEGEKTELDINIQKKTSTSDRLMMIWEKCSSFAFKQYAADESLRHSQGIEFGSPDADVYLYMLRAYTRDLTSIELLNNFIVDGADGEEILARDVRNSIYDRGLSGELSFDLAAEKNPDMDFILVRASQMSIAKKKNGGSVPCEFVFKRKSGGNDTEWTATGSMDLQGTSSEEHATTAGANENFRISDAGITLDNGTVVPEGFAMHGANSIPVRLFNYKKNVASQDHIVNRVSSKWYQDFQPYVRAARQQDPRVRDCLECTMCAVFFENTSEESVQIGPDLVYPGQIIFYGLGNLCSSKDSFETFQYDPIVIEVKQNPSDIVRFKSKDLTADNWDDNYEFRYIDEDTYTEEQGQALFKSEVQDFIFDTDWTAATNAALPETVTIDGVTYASDSAAYRKAKWKAEAANHFEMDTLYWHHIVTLFFLLRDNRAKNMFWARSAETGKWNLVFNWDNDTGLGRNNRGYLDIYKAYMDWDTLGTQEVFNASDNALFTNLRENNFRELMNMYLDREAAGAWNLDAIYKYVVDSQDQICEALWIEDAEHNAIRILENLNNVNYLERATGKLQLHIRKMLELQKTLVDSYFLSQASLTDRASLRGNMPSEGNWSGVEPSGLMTITPYTDMYINLRAGNTDYRERAYAGVPVTLDVSANLNDTEMYLYNSQWIQDMGNLTALYLSQCEIGNMKRLKKLILGTADGGYYNTGLRTVSIGNCIKLEELNVAGNTGLRTSLNLENNLYLKIFDSRGSAITGIRFARNGRLITAYINDITSLYMNGLWALATCTMEGYSNIQSVTVENTPTINTQAIAENGSALEYVRLIGIDWMLSNGDLLKRIDTLEGLSDSGSTIDHAILDGTAHVYAISKRDKETLTAAFDNRLQIIAENEFDDHTVTFMNWDGTMLAEEIVGDDESPTAINVPSSRLVRPSANGKDYTFDGWALTMGDSATTVPLSDLRITTDGVVLYAHYAGTPMQLTVEWYMEGVLKDTKTVTYGSEINYSGETLTHPLEGQNGRYYLFNGWDKSTGCVKENMQVNAKWLMGTLPVSPSSGGPALNEMTLGEINAIVKSKKADEYWQYKDYFDIESGADCDFDNVESKVLIGTPTYFDGTSAMVFNGSDAQHPLIQLFDTNSPDFTLVIDYEFTSDGGAIVADCNSSDSSGFKYERTATYSQAYVSWGDKSSTYYPKYCKSRLVIRHRSGSDILKITSGMNFENNTELRYNWLSLRNVFTTELKRTTNPSTNAPLTIGGEGFMDGSSLNHATGWVHWAKIWFADLGDSIALDMGAWLKTTWRLQYTPIKYQMAATSAAQHAATFIFASSLDQLSRGWNNNNVGDDDRTMNWSVCLIREYLNTSLIRSFSKPMRYMIANTRLISSIKTDASSSVVRYESENYLFLPNSAEMAEAGVNWNTMEYYYYEMDPGYHTIPWMTTKKKRISLAGGILDDNFAYFEQLDDPSTSSSESVVSDSTIWNKNGSVYVYISPEKVAKHKNYYGMNYGRDFVMNAEGRDADGNYGGVWARIFSTETRTKSINSTYINTYRGDGYGPQSSVYWDIFQVRPMLSLD